MIPDSARQIAFLFRKKNQEKVKIWQIKSKWSSQRPPASVWVNFYFHFSLSVVLNRFEHFCVFDIIRRSWSPFIPDFIFLLLFDLYWNSTWSQKFIIHGSFRFLRLFHFLLYKNFHVNFLRKLKDALIGPCYLRFIYIHICLKFHY